MPNCTGLQSITLYQSGGGTLVGNLQVETDSGGSPSGTIVTNASKTSITLNAGSETLTYFTTMATVTAGNTYWIVFIATSGYGDFQGGITGTSDQCKLYSTAWYLSSNVENIYFKTNACDKYYTTTGTATNSITIPRPKTAQKITSGASVTSLSGIQLYMSSGGTLVGNARVETDSSGNPSGTLADDPDSQKTGVTLTANSTSTIDFSTEATISNSTDYWIVFEKSTGGGTFQGGTTGTTDRCKYYQSGTWTLSSSVENIYFRTHFIDKSYTTTGIASETIYTTNTRIAQRFVAGYTTISGVTVYMTSGGSLSGTLGIYSDASGSPDSSLASNSVTLNAGSETTTFFSTPYASAIGTTYWVVFQRSGGTGGTFQGNTSGTADQCKYYASSAWNLSSSVENIVFKVHSADQSYTTSTTASESIGSQYTKISQKFTSSAGVTSIRGVSLWMSTGGTLVGDVRIETDSSGIPSGTLVDPANSQKTGVTLNANSETMVFFDSEATISASTTYWVVFVPSSGTGTFQGGRQVH